MSDSNPTAAPNAAPAAPENAKVFGYDVAAQAKYTPAQKLNPKSPLAAG